MLATLRTRSQSVLAFALWLGLSSCTGVGLWGPPEDALDRDDVPVEETGEGEASSPAGTVDPEDPAPPTPRPPPQERVYGAWLSSRLGAGGYLQNVVIAPSQPQTMYAYTDVGGLYRSKDGGKRWRMLHGALPSGAGSYQIRGLLVDPNEPNRLVMASSSGVHVSDDGGLTWARTLATTFNGNEPTRMTGQVLRRHPGRPNVLFAASRGRGVFQSDDGGDTWRPLGLTGTLPIDVHVSSRAPERVLVVVYEESLSASTRPANKPTAVWAKEGTGEWGRWTAGGARAPSELAEDTTSGSLVGLCEWGRACLSLDEGRTWADWSEDLPVKLEGADGALSGGASPYRYQALALVDGSALIAGGRGAIFRRAVQGSTGWTRVERASVGAKYEGEPWFLGDRFGWATSSLIVHPEDARRWFLTDWYAIWQTTDAGATWSMASDGVEVAVIMSVAQDAKVPGRIHLGAADLGYTQSTDGAATFRRVLGLTGSDVRAIDSAHPGTGAVFAIVGGGHTCGTLRFSPNGGAPFTAVPMFAGHSVSATPTCSIAADPRAPARVFVTAAGNLASGGGVYRAERTGSTWQWGRLNEGLPAGVPIFLGTYFGATREIAISPSCGMVALSGTAPGSAGAVYWHDGARWKAAQRKDGSAMTGTPLWVVSDHARPGRFYVSVRDTGVFRSDDGGARWHLVRSGSAHRLATDQAVADRLAVGTSDGVVLSYDGGGTWCPVDGALPQRYYTHVAFGADRLVVGTGGSGAFVTTLPASCP